MKDTHTQVRVSYIMTTKNRSKYFAKALQNIREFITTKDELIIIDGGSTDETLKLIKKNRDIISYFESEKDYGEAHALNKGILQSRGKLLKILTDDDYIYPKALRQAISVLERNPQIDAIQCGGEAYNVNEKTGETSILFYEQVFPEVEIAHNLLHVSTYCPCGLGLVLTRKIISRAGLFDTTFRAVDLSYMSKLILCNANFKYLNISLFRHMNYEHSGENFVRDIHRDEARAYLDHGLWEQTMRVETPVLEKVLGLDKVPYGRQLLRSIKLLDLLRRKHLTFPILLLDGIAVQKDVWENTKQHIKTLTKKKNPPGHSASNLQPIPPKRDGKFW
jgi:glycosyltransferase involved in cell wall biosynthesis